MDFYVCNKHMNLNFEFELLPFLYKHTCVIFNKFIQTLNFHF